MKRTAQKGISPVRAGWPGVYQALGRMAAVGSKVAAVRPWRGGGGLLFCRKFLRETCKLWKQQESLLYIYHLITMQSVCYWAWSKDI